MQIDVFNGDADGICALIQLRLAKPCPAQLVTGLKRDIELLARVSAKTGDQVTVLDISLAKNRPDLDKILQQGAEVFYVDHHQAGEIPQHPKLSTIIITSADICTSLLVNQHLQNQHLAWGIVGAFGDNLNGIATELAKPLSWSATQLQQIKDLGICINYNGYGNSLSDLHFAPDSLYLELVQYPSPLTFIQENPLIYNKLLAGYRDDLTNALQIKAEFNTAKTAVYSLPDYPWARRISGVFGNELASRYPGRAHAIITLNGENGYQISVRAPLLNKTGADELCSRFATGGGRKSAAGINHLPKQQLAEFIDAFAKQYS